jgi:hypothetical protein
MGYRVRGRSINRELDGKDASPPFAVAVGADPPVVQLGDVSSDGEAQAAVEAAAFVKALEDSG